MNKNMLADIFICLTLLGFITITLFVISYINQLDTSGELQNFPPYNLYWFQQALPSAVIGLLPIYIIITKPQLRLNLMHELLTKF